MPGRKAALEVQLKIERARYQVALRAEAETHRVSPETDRIAHRIERIEAELVALGKRPRRRARRGGAEDIQTAEREREAIGLRAAGLSYDAIAEKVGYANRSLAYKAVIRVLDRWRVETREDACVVRDLEVERLDSLLAGVWQRAAQGEPAAIDRVLKIMDRRARLLGLDAPAQHDVTSAGGPIDFSALSLEELEKIARGTSGGNPSSSGD